MESSNQKSSGRPITCDQVVWILDVFDRVLPKFGHPSVSREREMKKYGMLYEVMEVANLTFADSLARNNGTPQDVRQELKPSSLGHPKPRPPTPSSHKPHG